MFGSSASNLYRPPAWVIKVWVLGGRTVGDPCLYAKPLLLTCYAMMTRMHGMFHHMVSGLLEGRAQYFTQHAR